MKQKITKLFVSFLSIILVLPQLIQADFIYTDIPSTINPFFASVSQAYLNDRRRSFGFHSRYALKPRSTKKHI